MEKRSMTIAGHRTSVALEPEYWQVLERIAAARGRTLATLVAEIDGARAPTRNLASAIRVAILTAPER
ncbi:aryl-sulfate sulfotransferase [Siculibacillus lacustris]|uniref:Aryl-sulfate sulfotransferase n=1 Tax=Siculibacillus lacustris TaxID=1549641 RepID=A0A4Q9VU75_9HYPH|nr:ribbon-helix-helix domain-containing protein [Siculibacillus lacustris]TBW38683.1 aryl-sulfate sulfotransferase [Siculibacillus lacustris]